MGLADLSEKVKKYEELKNRLKKEVIGQDKAVEDVVNALANSELYESKSNHRPRGIFLFAGTPGVGKTFLATKCAEFLGCESLTLNMSAYNDKEASNLALFGEPFTYKGSTEGALIKFVADQGDRPCIVILDEIEKAHKNVIMQFLQILESGVTDNIFAKSVQDSSLQDVRKHGVEWALERPTTVSFANVYFFFTTNAGRPLYENGKQPDPDLTKDAIIDAIRKDKNPDTKESYFPDAILSRFQTGTVIMFRHLNTTDLIGIGVKEIVKTKNLISKRYGLQCSIAPDVVTLLLLREGGRVDARNFRKINEAFVQDQITGLVKSLRTERLEAGKIVIEVDPEEREKLKKQMYGEQRDQDVILVCEDRRKLGAIGSGLDGLAGIHIMKTDKYGVDDSKNDDDADAAKKEQEKKDREKKDQGDAMSMIREEVFSTPVVFVVMPSVQGDESLTVASNNSVMQSRKMQRFKKFVENVMKFNEKTVLCTIALEHVSDETKRDLLAKGVADIYEFVNAQDDIDAILKKIQDKVQTIRMNNMAFDFARKGKALKFDVAPVAVKDTVYVRLRFFEKIDNIKSGDDEFLIGQERMPNVSFDKVVGGDRIKAEAADFISFLQDPRSFVKRGLTAPKGLLFYGPPGTGKTYMAKAIAHEADVPFIATNGGEIRMGKGDKSGVEVLRQYFDIARRYAPSILFIDEMETIALNRTGRDPGADTIVNALLAEMDGFEGHDSNPVIVIGATNAGIDRENAVDGRYLDPAVVRRFTRKFFVDVPLKEDRMAHMLKIVKEDDLGLSREDLETAVQMSQGLSFGKINNAMEIAKRQAARENRRLTKEDIENAVETENYGEARAVSEESRIRTAYHEAGHACIGCLLGGAHMPDHATITSRGNFGGYVGTAADETDVTCSKEYMENRVRIALAGRCAEIIHYGDFYGLTAGPSSDIKAAYNIIVEMACHWGMDERVGMTYYALPFSPEENVYMNLRDWLQDRVNELFQKYYDEAMEMLTAHPEMLEAIAKKLLAQESLGKADLEEIVERYNG